MTGALLGLFRIACSFRASAHFGHMGLELDCVPRQGVCWCSFGQQPAGTQGGILCILTSPAALWFNTSNTSAFMQHVPQKASQLSPNERDREGQGSRGVCMRHAQTLTLGLLNAYIVCKTCKHVQGATAALTRIRAVEADKAKQKCQQTQNTKNTL